MPHVRVSKQVKKKLDALQKKGGHTSMDSTIRSHLPRARKRKKKRKP